jgi:hypothetical protein
MQQGSSATTLTDEQILGLEPTPANPARGAAAVAQVAGAPGTLRGDENTIAPGAEGLGSRDAASVGAHDRNNASDRNNANDDDFWERDSSAGRSSAQPAAGQ